MWVQQPQSVSAYQFACRLQFSLRSRLNTIAWPQIQSTSLCDSSCERAVLRAFRTVQSINAHRVSGFCRSTDKRKERKDLAPLGDFSLRMKVQCCRGEWPRYLCGWCCWVPYHDVIGLHRGYFRQAGASEEESQRNRKCKSSSLPSKASVQQESGSSCDEREELDREKVQPILFCIQTRRRSFQGKCVWSSLIAMVRRRRIYPKYQAQALHIGQKYSRLEALNLFEGVVFLCTK